MASLPPEPEQPKRRRTWLWILVGFIAVILLCCCAGVIYASTDSGQRRVERWQTEISDRLTEEAGDSGR